MILDLILLSILFLLCVGKLIELIQFHLHTAKTKREEAAWEANRLARKTQGV